MRLKTSNLLRVALFSIVFCTCRHAPPKASKQPMLLKITNYNKLQSSIANVLTKFTDSGTINGRTFNFPDTLKQLFRNPLFCKYWLTKLVNKKLLFEVSELSKNMENHGLNPEFYHSKFISNCSWTRN